MAVMKGEDGKIKYGTLCPMILETARGYVCIFKLQYIQTTFSNGKLSII